MVTGTHLSLGDYHILAEMFLEVAQQHILDYVNLFIFFGVRKNCLNSGWCQSVLTAE